MIPTPLKTVSTILLISSFLGACSHNPGAPQYSSQPQIEQSQPQASRQPAYSQQQAIAYARNELVKVAHQTLGTRYKWAGNHPREGFDCSGLMKFIYQQSVDYKIPRTTTQQRLASRTIPYQQLQPGDLLFFKTGPQTEHVGIYIGNRKFIHASTGQKKVVIAKMDSSYWFKRFVKFGTFI